MKITADTAVLVRALVQNDPEQARAASEVLEQAELVAIPLPVLWLTVLRAWAYPCSCSTDFNAQIYCCLSSHRNQTPLLASIVPWN